jgi:hypothetical protein
MASLVDVQNDPGDVEGLQKSLTEAVTAEKALQQDPTPAPAETKDPLAGSKFQGKSMEDILESYNNLESAYGRMANDLGTQRKLTDQLLDLKRDNDLQSNAVEPLPKVDPAQLLDDPTQALDSYLAEREARIRSTYDQRLSQMEANLQADKFMQKHPDFMETGQSEDFRNWATATPIRSKAAAMAAQGDWDAADALLQEYKAEGRKSEAPSTDSVEAEARAAAKQVSLESAASEGGTSSGKIYRRADLIELKLRKPHVYGDPGFQAEILKAYSEGRVK